MFDCPEWNDKPFEVTIINTFEHSSGHTAYIIADPNGELLTCSRNWLTRKLEDKK